MTGLAGVRVGIELAMLCVRRDNDVPSREEEYCLAFAAFADEDTSRALTMRSGSGSDLQAECRSEGTAYGGGCVIGRDIIVELRTG